MGGYLHRLVGRSFGRLPTVLPLIRPAFAPGPEVVAADPLEGWSESVSAEVVESAPLQARAPRPWPGEPPPREAPEAPLQADEVAEVRPLPRAGLPRQDVEVRAQPPKTGGQLVASAAAVEDLQPTRPLGRPSAGLPETPAQERDPRASVPAPAELEHVQPPFETGVQTPRVHRRGETATPLASVPSTWRSPAAEPEPPAAVLDASRTGARPSASTPQPRGTAREAEDSRAPSETEGRGVVPAPTESARRPDQAIAARPTQPLPRSLEQPAPFSGPAVRGREAARGLAETRSTPVVHVTIGRIEVRAVTAQDSPAPPRASAARPKPELSLEDYLKQRNGS
jgi:hypothetical protein